ncbi:Alpha/Beta hydrolase protein [Aspergillus karnatakaensis]|uniref:alpha/beta hydrolase n=1 Tax=Aspergillus karnatakaensis TaxID=1810916 RepID=UPI003CCE21CF
MTQWTFTPGQPGTGVVQNMASWTISRHDQEPYQIDISWPLAWSSRKDDSVASANVVYLVDGNALFLTATEALRRRESHRPRETGTIVVAIGYPLDDSVFSPRRSFDLTPSCEQYTPPDGPDGKPKQEDHGGADKFLRFITEVVRPFIQEKIFPGVSFTKSGLFGHSYGGLFVLHTLFTRPGAFDAYLAASPSIWWNDRFVLSEAERFCAERGADTRPVLRLSFGSREQDPVAKKNDR